jgi:hypothetical protein
MADGGPVALCLGGAGGVWADLRAAEALIGDRDRIIVACNFAGIAYPGVLDGWATVHPEHFEGWRYERAARGGNVDYRAIVHAADPGCPDVEVLPARWDGSSGLFMAQAALELMGASGAILCGVPMDGTGGHIHWPGSWKASARYQAAFGQAQADGAAIRSMSGFSRQVLGAPDAAWLSAIGVGPRQPDRVGIYINMEVARMRVRFTRDFDYSPSAAPGAIIAYRAGTEQTVKREAGLAAIAKGRAVKVAAPGRSGSKASG